MNLIPKHQREVCGWLYGYSLYFWRVVEDVCDPGQDWSNYTEFSRNYPGLLQTVFRLFRDSSGSNPQILSKIIHTAHTAQTVTTYEANFKLF